MKKIIYFLIFILILSFLPLFKVPINTGTCINSEGNAFPCPDKENIHVNFWSFLKN